jgi:hypothetical protein
MFSQLTIEKIGCYVYCLINPEDNSTFYIGKGVGNRVFTHAAGDLDSNLDSEKIEIIRNIRSKGLEVEHYIIRYRLTEKEAFEVEAALIDFVGIENLTNIVKGHHTEKGKISCKELDVLLGAEKINIIDNVLIIKINTLYRTGMTLEEIYEATRQSWVLNKEKVKNVDYVLSVHSGIVREVFKPTNWFTVKTEIDKNRIAFEGEVADTSVRNRYLYKSIEEYLKKGIANPIQYVFGKNKEISSVEDEIELMESNELLDVTEEANVEEKSLFIRINSGYREGITKEELFRVTSFCWRLSLENATQVNYVFSIYQGTVLEVYKPISWYKDIDSNRIAFNGEVAESTIREKYIGKTVKHYFKPGESNPCKYINL